MLDLGILQVKIKASGDKEVQKQLEEIEKSVNDMKTGFKKAGDGIKQMSQAAVGAVTAITAALAAAAETTKRYREDMAKLKTAFESQNKTVDEAKSAYLDFYGILGESDRSVEAVNHLAELTNNTKELSEWSDIAAGVTAKFGDSLPIEGLTEAANETAKTGSVTGVLADALNWAGISEDGFNGALEKCSDEQERATLITSTLSNTYKSLGEEYRALNSDIIAQREAQAQLNDAWAEIGASVQPVITELTEMLSEFVTAVLPKVLSAIESAGNLITKLFEFIIANADKAVTAVVMLGSVFMGWKIGSIISGVVQAMTGLISAFKTATTAAGAFNAVCSANPYAAVAAVVGILAGALVSYKLTADDSADSTQNLSNTLAELESQTADNIKIIEEKRDAELAEIAVTETMFDRLLELDGELKNNSANTQDNAAKKAELKSLVEQLNAVSPQFQLAVNSETGALLNQSGAVRQLANDYVTLAKAKAMADAYSELMKTSAQKMAKAQTTIAEEESKITEVGKTTDGIPVFNARIDGYSQTYTKAKKMYAEGEAEFNKYLQGFNEQQKIINSYSGVDFSGKTAAPYTVPHDNYTPTSTPKTSKSSSSSSSASKSSSTPKTADYSGNTVKTSAPKTTDYSGNTVKSSTPKTTDYSSDYSKKTYKSEETPKTAEEIKAEYDSWINEKKTELIRYYDAGMLSFSDFISELTELRDSSYAHTTVEFAEISQIIKSYYDAEVGKMKDELGEQYRYGEITFEEYIGGLVKITNENYIEGSREYKAAVETIGNLTKERSQNIITDIQNELSALNLIPTAANESLQNGYQLWLLQNRNATAAEKNAKQTELLNATLKNDIKQRENLLTAYDKMAEETGENSSECLVLKSSIEKLDISIQETNNSLDDIKKENENSQKQDLYTGFKLRSEMMKLGYTHEEAMEASEAMGYGITINQTFNTPTVTPSQIENATKAGIKDMEVKLLQ